MQCRVCKIDKDVSNFHKRTDRTTEKYYTRCKECDRINNCERRKKLKESCINYKGGKCIKCGYNKCIAALEFHHLDPTQKDFEITNSVTSWNKHKNKLILELDKCILVCANCHREIHYK